MKYLLLLCLFLVTNCGSIAQTSSAFPESEKTIVIDATGEYQAPANQIRFHINISRFHENAEIAFEEHKKLERYLTDLLLETGFDQDNISSNPVSISTRRYSNERGFETSQRVSILLDDITEFESMQVRLIKNGFDNFSGGFSTSEEKEARDRALANAVKEAKRNAAILADAAGKRVGEVLGIEYTTSRGPVYREAAALSMPAPYDGGMLQFQTTIPVQENVRVRFSLVN